MAAAKRIPFRFADLNAPADEERASDTSTLIETPLVVTPSAPVYSAEDVEAARAEGFAAGEHAVRTAFEAEISARLALVAEQVASAAENYEGALDRERAALRAAAAEFLQSFSKSLSAAQALNGALALVDRLLSASADRAAATLKVSDGTFERYGAKLKDALATRGASFVEVATDETLAAGECRLEWRGGGARRDFRSIVLEIERLTGAASAEASKEELP
jgi:flagellar biosynthesis/type III secretory pathway protein FliH